LLIAQQDGASDTEPPLDAGVLGRHGLVAAGERPDRHQLPGGVLVLYSLLSGDRGIWRRLHIGVGLPLFLLIALPWFVLVACAIPEQPAFFFIHEHWDRFFLKEHHREGPWYYSWYCCCPPPCRGRDHPVSLAAARRKLPGRFQPVDAADLDRFHTGLFQLFEPKLPGYMLPVFRRWRC
jgi:hypothetical protein